MKKLFRNIGITTIVCLSVIISEKTSTVVKEIDANLTQLRQKEKEYYRTPINAIIKDNTIIPGLYGKKINIDKTYKEIKKLGKIKEEFFIYDYIKPEISIKNQYDKYIIKGNQNKKAISLIFIIKEGDNIKKIIEILEKQNIKTNFFIEEKWLEENIIETEKIIQKGNIIEKLNNEISTNVNLNNILNKQIQSQKYCYTEKENQTKLMQCKNENKYTIKTKQIYQNPLKEIKTEITNGSIITLTANKKTKEELELIIKYIKTKGYQIQELSELLSEKTI